MNFSKIINFEFDSSQKKSMQQKGIKALAAFLIFMLLFTILSRSASGLTIAKVKTASPEPGTINHDVEISGQIYANKDLLIYTEPNIRIASVDIAEGAPVKKGDILFHLDLSDLKEQISAAKDSLKKAELQQLDSKKAKETLNKNRQTAVTRATEDYNNTLASANAKVQRALADMNEAKAKLDDYKKNGSDTSMQSALEADYNTKKGIYEDAVQNKESSMLTAQRALDDAKNAVVSDHSGEIEKIDMDAMKKNIAKMEEPLKSNGEIRAAADGRVKQINVAAGNRTSDGAAVVLMDSSSGFCFKGQVSEKDSKNLKVGDAATLTLNVGNAKVENIAIDSLYASLENENVYNVLVNLPSDIQISGSAATLEIKKQSDNYNICVPLDALHVDGAKTYVLIVEEKQSVLGSVTTVERMDVEVQDKDSANAGISGSFLPEQKFVISTNKPLKPGDRVRLEE